MSGRRARCLALSVMTIVGILVAPPTWGQSLATDGNIETAAQLVSKVSTGTAPLAVSSTTMVPSLNADQVDGIEGSDLALDADLSSAEAMLVALQAQVDALGLALVPRTGQATCYDAAGTVTTCGSGIGLGQDGHLATGVQWPNPRFTINESSPGVPDGTVTDNLTGLIWLANANCFPALKNWSDALVSANGLFDGSTIAPGGGDCGLTDGSVAGQWRLPNVRELESLVHLGVFDPALPNTAGTGKWTEGDPFSGVQALSYWSSTTIAATTGQAWGVFMVDGGVSLGWKTVNAGVWPVRDGQ